MAIDQRSVVALSKILSHDDVFRLVKAAAAVDSLEQEWMFKLEDLFLELAGLIAEAIERGAPMYVHTAPFLSFFEEHQDAVWQEAYAQEHRPGMPAPHLEDRKHLAKKPRGKKPQEKKRQLPKKQKEAIAALKTDFFRKAQELYRKHSEDFRAGNVFDQQSAILAIQKALRTTQNQAKTIVATETTRFYNDARREIYDSSDDVTHYLYVCIRDFRTTEWCLSRGGLVYKKGDPLLDKETPPIHWSCRSEILPLSPQNPVHLKLIKNKERAR